MHQKNHNNQKNHRLDDFKIQRKTPNFEYNQKTTITTKPRSDRMINEQYKHSALTAKVIGCAMTVHKTLGNGFQEVIYQRALAIEMRLAGIGFAREFEMPIFYRELQIGTRRVDFFVENLVSVEIKAVSRLEDTHFAQAINYLEAYNLEIGLLINFGEMSLKFKRLNNKKYKEISANPSQQPQ